MFPEVSDDVSNIIFDVPDVIDYPGDMVGDSRECIVHRPQGIDPVRIPDDDAPEVIRPPRVSADCGSSALGDEAWLFGQV